MSPASPPMVDPVPSKVMSLPSGRSPTGTIDAPGSHSSGVSVLTVRLPALAVSGSDPAVTPSSLSAKTFHSRHQFAPTPTVPVGFWIASAIR